MKSKGVAIDLCSPQAVAGRSLALEVSQHGLLQELEGGSPLLDRVLHKGAVGSQHRGWGNTIGAPGMSTSRRNSFPSRLLIPLFLIVAFTIGCQTTVGN